jgi:hypothetical protein
MRAAASGERAMSARMSASEAPFAMAFSLLATSSALGACVRPSTLL